MLEGAKQQGKATGLISTSEIQHATPAGFSAHVNNRSQYGDIAEQQVYQNIDVVLGGGLESLSPGTTKNARQDGEDLIKVLNEKIMISLKHVMSYSIVNPQKFGKLCTKCTCL